MEQAAQGLAKPQISRQLLVSPHTVKTHLGHAMAKVDARDRTQMVVVALCAGLVWRPREP